MVELPVKIYHFILHIYFIYYTRPPVLFVTSSVFSLSPLSLYDMLLYSENEMNDSNKNTFKGNKHSYNKF